MVKNTTNHKMKMGVDNNIFPIVGIGASAGGLEALEQFFQNVPANSGMAFVVIQHLDPDHVGVMPALLQRITPMTVLQATDRLKVKPNFVYMIPPNKSMSLLKGALHLSEPVESRGLRLPVDIFFRSLADEMQENSIGIILSGMGSDGSLGLTAIKEKGGVVLVQSPETASFDGMPSSAIDAVNVDIVETVEELPKKLISYLKQLPVLSQSSPVKKEDINNIEKIIKLLREHSGHDFSSYKKNMLFRRIERRKGIHQIDKIQDYVRFLQQNPNEIDLLFKELLIGVTNFFRDPAVWDELKQNTLPELIRKLPDGYRLRAWVPACSTGEEAYSLAIVFKEAMEEHKLDKTLTLKIFATDIHQDAIDRARKGLFATNIEDDVSPGRISKFFTSGADGFRVNKAIREMVVFAPQNVIKDPPFTRLDLLTCRNLLIYMEPELQKKLLTLFYRSLNPGGILVLGKSETTGNQFAEFTGLSSELKIFKHPTTDVSPIHLEIPSSFHRQKSWNPVKFARKPVDNIQMLTDHLIIKNYAPASVLVNVKGDIIYITGHTGKYLEPAAGKANWNIHAMAREGLRQVLPGAFRKAIRTKLPVDIANLKLMNNGESSFVNMTIKQIENPEVIRDFVIVVFKDVPAPVEPEAENSKKSGRKASGRLKDLETELHWANEELQILREEMQTSQEELKSNNEELQSTNEELTTSKEEMQSLNEELQTVNIELQSKVSDYARTNDDMKNLLNSTGIATLFLDKKLRIRRYTERATKIINLRETDIGRPFTDLVTKLKYPEMDQDVRLVIKKPTTIEKEIETTDKCYYNIRIMPYRTVNESIDGLVITFTNITRAKKLENELKQANHVLRS